MTQVYLCHKCSGLLSDFVLGKTTFFYSCGCISGYIRDWQEPVDTSLVRQIQLDALKQRLDLYKRQDRPLHDAVVVQARQRMERLLNNE